ncbi:MAG: hypothetical protein M1819_003927 [Sarea resinae]|nr:MAG: hypothetical protein M1819_003927 [Sarea resinae]
MGTQRPPSSILVVGSGVFGLSTALALANDASYKHTRITLLDRLPFPPPDISSIDTSRIIRPDYADPAYSQLAAEAQTLWRNSEWGAEGRYTESGLVLTSEKGKHDYVKSSLDNVRRLESKEGNLRIQELKNRVEVEETVRIGGGSGDWGYVNWNSGWANAEAAMIFARQKLEKSGRVDCRLGEVKRLLIRDGCRVEGVELAQGGKITAELVVLATGAWTAKFVDLQGRAESTGQVLAYIDITDEEQKRLEKMPVLLNMSTGMFIIPPRENLLKVARHGYGYTNPTRIPHPEKDGSFVRVSVPRTHVDAPEQWIPKEGEDACRKALKEMIPALGDRPWKMTRICWYTDTPKGDFLITYHPQYEGLFLATGGSGHGFKFLPVIGEKIVQAIRRNTPKEFKEKWAWPKPTSGPVVTEDGSRGDRKGMVLDEELRKGSRL